MTSVNKGYTCQLFRYYQDLVSASVTVFSFQYMI